MKRIYFRHLYRCKGIFILILPSMLQACTQYPDKIENNINDSIQFSDSLINKLSLEQKVALLHGMGGGNSEFGDLDVRFFGIGGNEDFGIPPFFMGHGITGVRSGRDTSIHATYFTTPIAIGCSWDTELYNEVGTAIAKEMRALGQDLSLGPTLNIIRHPLGGRNWESFSEDPYLTSRMGVAYTKAVQNNGIVSGPKHFVANNQETNRFDINNEVDERTLREIYLPAFKAAVKEGGALNIMGAYNRVNNDYMCHNEYLLDSVLRGEWGFGGFVLSDFANGVKDTKEAVDARMNVEMHRPKYYSDSLINLVKKGEIPETRIDELLKDVFIVMYKMNLFDRERFEDKQVIRSNDHLATARKVAQNTPILLKNEGILPLKQNELNSLAIIGPNAKPYASLKSSHANYAYYLQGGGSGRTYYFHNSVVDPFTGIGNAIREEMEVSYAQGAKTPNQYARNKELPIDEEDEKHLSKAIKVASKAETVVLVVGLSGFNESEGWDRNSATLPGMQNKLIQEVSKVNPNTIVVLTSGCYIDISSWVDDVKALLFVPYCGEQIGNGLADILTGKVNPSGKLPFTWVKDVDDYPKGSIFRGKEYTEKGISNLYNEGIFVGYRWFDKQNLEVQYPFGFGLSYTQFKYEDIHVDDSSFPIRVKAKVTNTGSKFGKEVVQLYLSAQNPTIEKALQELKGFEKVGLAAGEAKTVEFLLDKDDFAHYDVTNSTWAIEAGTYEIRVGAHSRSLPLTSKVTLPNEILE